jgi:hypothetical protein
MAVAIGLIALAIALYGAILATVDLALRRKDQRRAGTSLVTVSTGYETHVRAGEGGARKSIVMRISNLSPETVRITEYGWHDTRPNVPHHSMGALPPIEIPPRDGYTIREDVESVYPNLDLSRDVISWIKLSTGEEFTAPPVPTPEDPRLRPRRRG